jgi:glyoxylase-like metal-dependent hydrolase (beta-lactamase superfamily II)
VRHLLLSIDDRVRDARDRADLDGVLQRVAASLDALPEPRRLVVSPALEGVPTWWFETNAWIFAPHGRGGDCVVVDVPPRPRSLIQRLAAQRWNVRAVLLTHGHVDHAGGVGELLRAFGRVPVYVHAADVGMVLDPHSAAGPLAAAAAPLAPPPADCVVAVHEGDRIPGAAVELVTLETPGHTAGSCCFLGESMLFSGDHLFAGGTSGRCDLGGASRDDIVASTLGKLAPLPDNIVVLPGHGGATTIGAERARWHAADKDDDGDLIAR